MTDLKPLIDLAEQFIKREEELNRQVTVADGCLTIDIEYPYHIDLNRIDTPEKILGWVWHLAEKTWFTQDHARRFIEVALRQIGKEPDVPGA
jgi:hypothetical protein